MFCASNSAFFPGGVNSSALVLNHMSNAHADRDPKTYSRLHEQRVSIRRSTIQSVLLRFPRLFLGAILLSLPPFFLAHTLYLTLPRRQARRHKDKDLQNDRVHVREGFLIVKWGLAGNTSSHAVDKPPHRLPDYKSSSRQKLCLFI